MLDAKKETRVDMLQAACGLLQKEVSRQASTINDLAFRLAKAEGRELTQTELDLFQPACDRPIEIPRRKASKKQTKPQKGHGPQSQPELPREEKLFGLGEGERVCHVCDGQLEEMGVTEDSEEVTLVERTYRVVLNRRKKYRCRCNANIVTASGPIKLIPGGRYSLDFAVSIAVDKYADHLPLERQVARMVRQGLQVTSSTLFDQIGALAEVLTPTYLTLLSELLDGPVLHVDETSWLLALNGKPIGRKRHRKRAFTGTVWGLCSDQCAYYAILDSKSEEAGESLLATYSGVIVADGYQVYDNLSKPDKEKQRLATPW